MAWDPSNWNEFFYSAAGAAIYFLSNKGVQSWRARRASGDPSHESPSTRRLRKMEDDWKDRVNEELFSPSPGSMRSKFHAVNEYLHDHEARLAQLETVQRQTNGELADIKEKLEGMQPTLIETHILVKQLMAMSDRRGSRRD